MYLFIICLINYLFVYLFNCLFVYLFFFYSFIFGVEHHQQTAAGGGDRTVASLQPLKKRIWQNFAAEQRAKQEREKKLELLKQHKLHAAASQRDGAGVAAAATVEFGAAEISSTTAGAAPATTPTISKIKT
jgi:hypothetical protein